MAINKPTAIGGVSGNFWKTTGIYISPDYSHARATMALFTNQAAAVSGAAPIYQDNFLLTNAPFNLVNLGAISEADLLATVAQFSGGTYVSGT